MNRSVRQLSSLILVSMIMALNTACTVVGPNYVQPSVDVPNSYKEASDSNEQENSTNLNTGPWWAIYQDDVLNGLMQQIETQNFSLQAIEARLRQAQALDTKERSAQSTSLVYGGNNDLGFLVNWEVDLWGRIKRSIEASGANIEATQADIAAVKLSLQAQLAQAYFMLRVQDADLQLLHNTASSYEQSLKITLNQYNSGVADRSNVAHEQAQLGTTQVLIHEARITRAELEHTIAQLIGKAPSEFSLTEMSAEITPPYIPATLPAELLERRPDIVAAERRMAITSAKIGVAEAAAYPTLGLGIGVSIAHGLIGGSKINGIFYDDGGVESLKTGATAVYDESVANYRQTVVNSFREVEDNLAALNMLSDAAKAQAEVISAANEVVTLNNNQYKAGIINYQSLIIAQGFALANERSALSILSRRLVAGVKLIKALGGGWTLPKTKLNDEKS